MPTPRPATRAHQPLPAKPDGSTLWTSSTSNKLIDATVLPGTGTYRFLVDPGGVDAGSVTVKSWSVPADVDGGSFLIDGAAKTLTTTAPGQNGSMTFTGTQGQRIQFQTSGSTFTDSGVYWKVYKPDESTLWTSSTSNKLISPSVLPVTGIYRFFIDPGGVDVGSVDHQSVDRPVAPATLGPGEHGRLEEQLIQAVAELMDRAGDRAERVGGQHAAGTAAVALAAEVQSCSDGGTRSEQKVSGKLLREGSRSAGLNG